MKLRKVLAIVLCVAMVLSTMGFSVFATEEPAALSDGEGLPVADDMPSAYWSSNADTTWYNETDTEFTITTAEQLAGLAELVDGGNTFKDKTIKLGNDINLWGEDESGNKLHFNPIGHSSNEKSFNGTFDGQGHTISNLYQQSDLDAWQYEGEYYGLFAYTNGATIQNLTIDGAYVSSGRNEAAAVVGNANNTKFFNITVSNSTMIVYNNSGAAVASECYGDCSFEQIKVTEDTVVGPLWGTYDARCGGVVGLVHAGNNVSFKDVTVACKIDGINDVAANYQYWLYRYCGMLIGQVDGVNGVADPTGYVTCDNVKVTIGEWANYHYCEFASLGAGSYNGPGEYKYARVEAGTGTDGIDLSTCNHAEDESHNVLISFNQLFGGGQGVKGLAEYDGVTVTDDAAEEREANMVAELFVAASTFSGENVELVSVGKFETLQTAIDAIGTTEGDYVIKVLKDISDNVTIKQAKGVNITIDGDGKTYTGTIIVDGKNRSTGTETLTINNVNFVAEGEWQSSIETKKSSLAHNITVDGCTFTGANKQQYGIRLRHAYNIKVKNTTGTKLFDLVYGNNAVTGFTAENITVTDSTNGIWLSYVNSTADFSGLDIDVDATGVGFVNNTAGTITIEDSDIKAEAPVALSMNNATNQLTLTIAEENGIFESTDPDGDAVSATGNVDKLNASIYGGAYSSDVTAYLADGYIISTNEHGYYIPNEDNSGSNAGIATPVATSVKASLVPVEGNPNKYDVVLTANESAEIHRFLSAELNIKFKDEDSTPLSIKSVVGNADYGIEVIDPNYNESGVWGFHLDDKAIEATGNNLTIATVELMGYGKGELIIAPHANNKVEAIQSVDNNIVKGYLVTNTEDGILVIDQTIHNVDLKVPTKDLTIEITFPNPIEDQIAAYQDMTVVVDGDDIDAIETKLGLDACYLVEDGDIVQYVITLNDKLTENNSYNITVTGAGYRTADYRVTMTEDKTVHFWNNAVKGEAITFEEGGILKAKTSFLAGDIAEDNIIDKYDLAAVVSYFGKYNLTNSDATYKYAKYDLNRDGNIDSEDIAYVLASFGY